MGEMEEIGPVDYLVVAFPGNEFRGEIAPAVSKLVESETIRIIDLAVVTRSEGGEVAALELSDLDAEVRAGSRTSGSRSQGSSMRMT